MTRFSELLVAVSKLPTARTSRGAAAAPKITPRQSSQIATTAQAAYSSYMGFNKVSGSASASEERNAVTERTRARYGNLACMPLRVWVAGPQLGEGN